MDFRPAAAVVLLAAGGWLVAEAESVRASPRAPAGPATVLGGFTALAAQAVWLQADRAILAHDEDRAITLLRTLVELEPQIVNAARFAAWEIGWNMLDGVPDPRARWALAREAIAILSGCVAQNPRSATALVHRARYLSLKVAREPALEAAYRREMDARGGLEAAFFDYVRACELDPSDTDAASGVAFVGSPLARQAVSARRWDDAAVRLAATVRGLDTTLAAVRAEFGADLGRDESVLIEYERAASGRVIFAALLEVAEAPPDRREALLAAFLDSYPGFLE